MHLFVDRGLPSQNPQTPYLLMELLSAILDRNLTAGRNTLSAEIAKILSKR